MAAEAAPANNNSSSNNTATQRRVATQFSSDASAPAHSSSAASSSAAATATPAILPLKLISKLLNILTILLRVFLWPVFKTVNTLLFPLKEYDGIHNVSGGDRAARAFVSLLRSHIQIVRPTVNDAGGGSSSIDDNTNNREQYVEPACPFSERGYTTILRELSRRDENHSTPLLLIYLHSPLHRDSTKFIQKYLCHGPLLELLNNNNNDNDGSIVCFGTSIHSADGQRLREVLNVTSFPFMALLSVKPRSSSSSNNNNNSPEMELMLRLESSQILSIPPQQITTYLSSTIQRHNQLLAEALSARLAREEEVRLRREQDAEYQEALLQDQIREIERREEEERKQKEEEERREAELAIRRVEVERMEKARDIMSECVEPPAGSGVARIRFTLPNGKKIDRRFRNGETLEVLRAFLMVHFEEEGVEIKNIGVSTNYPRRTFGEEENGLSLEEAGLCPQAVVMVQDLDA